MVVAVVCVGGVGRGRQQKEHKGEKNKINWSPITTPSPSPSPAPSSTPKYLARCNLFLSTVHNVNVTSYIAQPSVVRTLCPYR